MSEDEQLRRHEATDEKEQSADQSSSRKTDEASGSVEKGNVQHGGSSSSTSQTRPSCDTSNVDAKPDEVQMVQ